MLRQRALSKKRRRSHRDRGDTPGLARATLYLAAIDFDLQRFNADLG
jgi:hypothetical protein